MILRNLMAGLGLVLIVMACGAEQEAITDDAASLWAYEVDMEQFMAAMRASEDTGVLHELDMSVVRELAQERRETFITDLIKYIREQGFEDPFKASILASGYESYADWERDGNGVYQAISVISFSKAEPQAYKEMVNASPAELEALLAGTEEDMLTAKLISRVPAELVEKVRPHYEYLVINRPDTAAADTSSRIEDYERAIATMIAFRSGDPVPELTPEQLAEYHETRDNKYRMAELMDYYDRYYPGVPELWAATLSNYGFYELGHWIETIDRMSAGVTLVMVKQNQPDTYQAMRDGSSDYEDLAEEERAFMMMLETFDEAEVYFIEENLNRVFEAITF